MRPFILSLLAVFACGAPDHLVETAPVAMSGEVEQGSSDELEEEANEEEANEVPQLCEYLRREIPSDDLDLDSCELLPNGVALPGGRRADIVEMFQSQGSLGWRSAYLVIREEGAVTALYFTPIFTGGAVREEHEGWYTIGELIADGSSVELSFDIIQLTPRTSPNQQTVEQAPQTHHLRCERAGASYSCEEPVVSP